MSNGRAPDNSHALEPARAIAAALLALVAMLAIAAPATAMKMADKATPEVQKWSSPKAFDSPYAYIDVKQRGRSLAGSPITRCTSSYVSEDIAVVVSTCGRRWRVKARFVSMSGHGEHFELVYQPRAKP